MTQVLWGRQALPPSHNSDLIEASGAAGGGGEQAMGVSRAYKQQRIY